MSRRRPSSRAPVRPRAFGPLGAVALAGVLGGSFAGCGSDEIPPPLSVMDGDPTAHDQALTDAIFEGVEPDAVVATVDGEPVHASDVAAWLDLHPGLTVEDAVQDLVDARLGANAARALRDEENAARFDIIERSARIRGRVLAWHRMFVRDPADLVPPDDLVDAWVAEPANTTRYGRPELARASQVLFRLGPDAPAELVATVEERATALADGLRADEGADIYALAEAGRFAHEAVDATSGYTVRIELGLIFPPEDSGEPNWPGIRVVVPEFAEAVFAAEPGTIVGPLRTEFGMHVVLVEGILPADVPDADTIRDRAVELLERDRRREHMIERMTDLRANLDIQIAEDNINLLALTGVERAAAVAQSRAATLR